MGHVLLNLLCIWSCVLTVTPLLTEEQVGRATNYIQQNIFANSNVQYAFFVKFNTHECNMELNMNVLKSALQEENPEDVRANMKAKNIYNGKRLVAAEFKRHTHSEYRLLNPAGSASAPVTRLLENEPPAACAIFFSLNSPCLNKCTNLANPANIIKRLNTVNNLPEYDNRAFVFRKLYRKDKGTAENIFVEHWGALNGVMRLMQCNGNNCVTCFTTPQNLNAYCYS